MIESLQAADLVERLAKAAADYEFDTFVVGFDRSMPAHFGLDEATLRDLKTEVGIGLAERWPERTVDFKQPQLRLDLKKDRTVHVRSRPVFFGGRYRKLSRQLSASAWQHLSCKGRGCSNCNYTGRICDSIQDDLSELALAQTKGDRTSFHGLGREDTDARMLGEGRPFVLEISEPVKRSFDEQQFYRELARRSQSRFEIWGLRVVSKEAVTETKEAGAEKTYRAWIRFDDDPPSDIKKLAESLSGRVLDQTSPTRVAHRRGVDTVRNRKVVESRWLGLIDGLWVWEVRAESGTYIKELVSGDQGRTVPSLAGVAGVGAKCVALDVLAIHWTPPWERDDELQQPAE